MQPKCWRKGPRPISAMLTGAVLGLVLNILILILLVAAVVRLVGVFDKQGGYVASAASVLRDSALPLAQADVPICVVCAIASHFRLPLQILAAEYVKDRQSRELLVLNNFTNDNLTGYYIKRFPSKFLTNGYDGEELLTASK